MHDLITFVAMPTYRKSVFLWLLCGAFMVFSMVVVGGITRLTHSGLSITEWNVIMGTLPPLSLDQWNHAFDLYRQSPEYKIVNHGMSLSDFQGIFWWEYIHRLLARLMGIVFLVPFLYFLFRKMIDRKLVKRLVFIFFLGGFQGFLGWFMVKSGLQDKPNVSHYRLAAHLLTAFTTFAFIMLAALQYRQKESVAPVISGALRKMLFVVLPLVVVQIAYGAFVAGLKAGRIYNTYPMMGDSWMPDSVYTLSPSYLNALENMAGVQFVHRTLALVILGFFGIILFMASREIPGTRLLKGIKITGAFLLLQIMLGIFTLLYAVPLTLGVLHQAVALLLFASVLYVYHHSKETANQKIVAE
jgi:cytochrome c oxidase assembly protein subunit 15